MNKGYPHIYTGNGKGKTTAAFGLHPIMFAGTGSDVGKSLLAALSAAFSGRTDTTPRRSKPRTWP